jgi:hypothetical protein
LKVIAYLSATLHSRIPLAANVFDYSKITTS